MKRRAARTDDNQIAIVDYFRSCGVSVAVTSGAGDGFPDLVIGERGRNFLLEVKDGEKVPSARRLTPKQKTFHDGWTGQVDIIESIDDAADFLQAIRRQGF